MTSRTRHLTLADEKKFFKQALEDAITIGKTVHGSTLDFDVKLAIDKVAHEYPSATQGSIRKAQAEWERYLGWRTAP